MSAYLYSPKGRVTKTGVRLISHTARGRRRRYTRNVFAADAIRTYFGRDLTSWDWIKDYDLAELRDVVAGHAAKARFLFHTTPFAHQLAAFLIGVTLDQFLFFIDMGGGKSKILLDLYRYHAKTRKIGPLLVCVPQPVNIASWADEAASHTPTLRVAQLYGSKKERIARLEARDYDVAVINYDGLLVLAGKPGKRKTTKAGASVRERVYHYALLDRYFGHVGMVAFDESHLIGGRDSHTWKACKRLSDLVELRYAATGTPFNGKNPAPVFDQFLLVDGGETFGSNFGFFRAAYYNEKYNGFGVEYKFDKRLASRLSRMMKHRSIRYDCTEFSDLPPITYSEIKCDLSDEAVPYYRKGLEEVRALAITGHASLEVTRNSWHRFRTLCSGFLSGWVNGEAEPLRVQVEFADNPKLTELAHLLDSIAPGKKVAIYHWYVHTGKMISKLLKKRKAGHAMIGGAATAKPTDELTRFLHDPQCTYLVANAQSAGTGINLQGACHYVVFFESPSDPTLRRQAEMRFQRHGQRFNVFVYDLVVRDSIEEDILAGVAAGEDFFMKVMHGARPLAAASRRGS